MGKKVYFFFILIFTIFTYYYQFIIHDNFSPLPILLFIRDAVLVAGGYSLYLNKQIFETKKWKLIFKLLMVITVGTFIYQIMPGSFYGDFSVFNGSFLTNVFVYLFFITLYLPLYFAVYRLGKRSSK